MSVDLATKYIVLGFAVDVDFVASADEAGNVSIVWLSEKTQPTQEQLDVVTESYISVMRYVRPFKVGKLKS